MEEFIDAETAKTVYDEEREKQFTDLNKIIVALRTKVNILEQQLEKERKEREEIPLPMSVIEQVALLEAEKRILLEDIGFFLKHVPNHIIINRLNKDKKPTRKGGLLR